MEETQRDGDMRQLKHVSLQHMWMLSLPLEAALFAYFYLLDETFVLGLQITIIFIN